MCGIFSVVFGSAALERSPGGLRASPIARWVLARREGLTLAALGVLALLVTLYWCAPGYMGPDSRSQFQQARSFEFSDDHPVLMALLWHYLDRLVPGPFGVLVLTNVLYWGGLSALFWVLPGPLGRRALGLLVVGFFPPGCSLLPIVYKDGLMQGALLVAIACLIPATRRALPARLALGAVCLLLAIGVRHNAAAAVWPFLALAFMRLQVLARLRRSLRLIAASAAGLALAFVMTLGVDRALAPLSRRTEFWQTVPAYDLAGMSLRTGELLVDRSSATFTRGMGLPEIRRLFRIEFGNAIYHCVPFAGQRCVPVFRYTLDRRELRRLSQNWLEAIVAHPAAYLAHRWALTRAMLTVNTSGQELYWSSTAPHGPLAAQYPPSKRLLSVLSFFERHIWLTLYSPWVYVLLGLVLFPLTLLRYVRGGAPLPLLLVLSGGAYLLSNLVGAIASEYRYCVWTITCVVLALFTLVAPQGSGALVLRRLFSR